MCIAERVRGPVCEAACLCLRNYAAWRWGHTSISRLFRLPGWLQFRDAVPVRINAMYARHVDACMFLRVVGRVDLSGSEHVWTLVHGIHRRAHTRSDAHTHTQARSHMHTHTQ